MREKRDLESIFLQQASRQHQFQETTTYDEDDNAVSDEESEVMQYEEQVWEEDEGFGPSDVQQVAHSLDSGYHGQHQPPQIPGFRAQGARASVMTQPNHMQQATHPLTSRYQGVHQ